MLDVEELNRYARSANKAYLQVPEATVQEKIAAALGGYLFLLKANKACTPEQYETIKNALQDIVGWFIVNQDVEDGSPLPSEKERILMEITK